MIAEFEVRVSKDVTLGISPVITDEFIGQCASTFSDLCDAKGGLITSVNNRPVSRGTQVVSIIKELCTHEEARQRRGVGDTMYENLYIALHLYPTVLVSLRVKLTTP